MKANPYQKHTTEQLIQMGKKPLQDMKPTEAIEILVDTHGPEHIVACLQAVVNQWRARGWTPEPVSPPRGQPTRPVQHPAQNPPQRCRSCGKPIEASDDGLCGFCRIVGVR
jgi:hypothetical protein